MGKIRAKTLGNEEQEQKEQEAAKARKEAKIAAAIAEGQARSKDKAVQKQAEAAQEKAQEEAAPAAEPTQEAEPVKEEKKVAKKPMKKAGKGRERSEKYKEVKALVEKNKLYSLSQALDLVEKTHMAKFDESVELHINTLTTGVNGHMTLPHGTGKTTKVAILAPAKDPKAADDLLKEIEAGKINFDILVATPDAMPRLAKVARILGPKGLMPNPKNGTITPKPEDVAKKFEGGQMNFKTEAKAPVMHLMVGKLSFGKEKLSANITAALDAVQTKNIKNVTLKSTMSPAVKLLVK